MINSIPETTVKPRNNEFEWRQFCKLGEMMGDGLHHEADGKWIVKEYKRLSKLLLPNLPNNDKIKRKQKAESIDKQMQQILLKKFCSCGGILKQKRSGTKVAYCQTCNARYVAKYKKSVQNV